MIAHIADSVSGAIAAEQLGVIGLGLCVVALIVLDARVRRAHGSPETSLRFAGLALLAITATAFATPLVGASQAGNGLPDLISDPPRPAFLKQIVDDAGQPRLVVTFDGYIHNIGDGPLDVVGNPQVEGGMVQRVRDGGDWREVATPTVRYETDDGHNHFHLIEAIDYVLWNEDLGSQTAAGSKIGFCLVDSEQIEPGADESYSEELDDFCQEGNPGATELRMGISPGWRDIYDATTTLQWVDVSDTDPGRYWIGALTDPNDEIVESDETNNDLVFSERPAIVPGWMPIASTVAVDAESVQIELRAEAFGTVGEPQYSIVEGPTSGTLDVPVGAQLSTSTVTYRPDAGFTGSDELVFSVRDASSVFPSTTATETITIAVAGGGVPAPELGPAPSVLPESTFFEMVVGEPFEAGVGLLSPTGSPVELFAERLPAGLRIDNGTIVGAAVAPGVTEVDLIGIDGGGGVARQAITIIVNPADGPGLNQLADLSSPLREPVSVQVARADLTATYSATDLPPGLELGPASPVVSGVPTETGSWTTEITETAADGTTSAISFTWTVRPAVAIDFAL